MAAFIQPAAAEKAEQDINKDISVGLNIRFTGFENRITTILGRFSVGFEN